MNNKVYGIIFIFIFAISNNLFAERNCKSSAKNYLSQAFSTESKVAAQEPLIIENNDLYFDLVSKIKEKSNSTKFFITDIGITHNVTYVEKKNTKQRRIYYLMFFNSDLYTYDSESEITKILVNSSFTAIISTDLYCNNPLLVDAYANSSLHQEN